MDVVRSDVWVRLRPIRDLAWKGQVAMKKGGILNPAICSLLAELGQTDELLIVDAAYPLPTDGHVIDLTLTAGIPRLLDVIRAVAEELVIESIAVPAEFREYSPRLFQEMVKILGDIDVDEVPFHEFKEQSLDVKGIIRTAEFSSYANVRIVAGSVLGCWSAGDPTASDLSASRQVCNTCQEKEARGGQPKPDSVEGLPGWLAAWSGLG